MNMTKGARVLGLLVAVSMGVGCAQLAQAQQAMKDKQVLVLPVVNVTGEKWQELKAKLAEETGKALFEQLVAKGYSPIPGAEAKSLVDEEKLDLLDEENWRKDTFFKLAEKSNSQYVVFVAITLATQRNRINLFSSVPEGDVTIKCWVLNAKDGKALLSAKSINAKARAKTNLFGEAKGSDAQAAAAKRAVESMMKEAFGAGS